MGEMAEWLGAQGHEVKVITAPPYYPNWNVAKDYSCWSYRKESHNGVSIMRCPLWVPMQPSGIKRILHLASFAISSFPIAMYWAFRWKPDLVFTVEPPLFCTPAALLGAKLGGAHSWLHIQDFEVDAAFDLGIIKNAWIRHLMLNIEHWIMLRFDCVSTISDNMLANLNKKQIAGDKQKLFPNWVELDRIKPLDRPSSFRTEWGLENKIVVLYSGNMGEKQGLEILLEVANNIQHREDIVIILCGDGAIRVRLEQQAKELNNIIFMPLQPLDSLNELLNLADIHILPQRADIADLVLPSKLTNMLASGRPVVATALDDTQVAKLVRDCGIIVPPGEAKMISDALIKLSDSEQIRKELGAAARSMAVSLWDKGRILSNAFKDILNS